MSRRLVVRLRLDDAAFAEDEPAEVARILREVAKDVANGYQGDGLRDINGNSIGAWQLLGTAPVYHGQGRRWGDE